jgi:hypothetical protein
MGSLALEPFSYSSLLVRHPIHSQHWVHHELSCDRAVELIRRYCRWRR